MVVDSGPHEAWSWLITLAAITMIGVGAGILVDSGLPHGLAGPVTIGLLAVGTALSVVALSARVTGRWMVTFALVGVGLCGAGVAWWSDGGFVIGYVSLVGLALRLPRRAALLAAIPVVAAIALAEAHDAEAPVEAIMSVLLGFGFLFITTAFAAVSLDARRRAEQMLAREAALRAQQEALRAQEAATSEARAHAAALAERSRLAHELHDVLAHSLAALSVQLETARLTAIGAGAGAELAGQIGAAHQLARIGMLNARRALQMLRDAETPGPGSLPELVAQTAAATSMPIAFRVEGSPRPVPPDVGLTVYRTVQEALTNVAKHAGHGARAEVLITWAPTGIGVMIRDSGGDGADTGLPSSGLGLTGMAERAARHGGRLEAGPGAHGFTVRLRVPLPASPRELADAAR